MPALLHSYGSRVKRRERFTFFARDDTTLIIPWLMEYTSRASAWLRGPTYEATDATKYEGASSPCHHPGGVSVVVRGLLAEPRAPNDEVTWERKEARFPGDDRASVSESAAAAVAASSTESGEGSVPNWRPEELDSQVAFDVIISRNALSGTEGDGLSFSYLQ